MKKIITALTLILLATVACNRAEKRVQSYKDELDVLIGNPTATSVAGAEKAYADATDLVTKIGKEKKAPQDLLDAAAALRMQRATEWKNVAWKTRDIGSTRKVLRALQESGAPILPDFKTEWNWGLGKDKLQSSAPAESLNNVDPTRDTPGTELTPKKKKGVK